MVIVLPGFKYLFVLLDINLCASGLCQNNASCENFRTFYTCNCAAGFEGVNCQTGKTLCQYDFSQLGKQPIFVKPTLVSR